MRCAGPRRRARRSTALCSVGLGVPLHAEHEAALPGSSIASGRSSRVETPLTSSPSPRRSTPWWWWDLVACVASPAAAAASEPAARGSTSWSAPSKEPTTRRCSSWPTSSGRCCSSVPPQRDVDQLHSAADAEHRQVALDRRARRARSRRRRARAPCRASAGAAARRRRPGRCPRRRRASGRRAGRAPRRGPRPAARRAPASAPGRRRAAPRRCRRSEQQRRGLVPHAPAARSSAVQMPITGRPMPHTIGSTRRRTQAASAPRPTPNHARPEETDERVLAPSSRPSPRRCATEP